MNRLTLIIGAVIIAAMGTGAGYFGAQQMTPSEPETSASIASTPAAANASISRGFADGFTEALDIVELGRNQSLLDADSAILRVFEEHGDAFESKGIEPNVLLSEVSAVMSPSQSVQQEFNMMSEDMMMAQDIARLAITERDAARIELVEMAKSVEVLEEQLSTDAVVQGFDAERTRLIASLALEQQRVTVLRQALNATDSSAAATAEQAITELGESDMSVQTLANDIDRLSTRYDQAIVRLEDARAQVSMASGDLTSTLDELEFANSQLSGVQTRLDETQAEFVELETQRTTAAAELGELDANLNARRIQLEALDVVGTIVDNSASNTTATTASGGTSAAQQSANTLAEQVSSLRELLQPLQQDFESQVQQQATLRAEVIAEDLAQTMALERAKVLADDIAQELADELAAERANILADLLARERVGEMTAEEIEALAGLRVVSEGTALDTVSPIRAYLYERLLVNSATNDRRLVGERLLLSTNTLFPAGGVALSAAGRAELRAFGQDLIETLNEADAQADGPEFLVQVNGHADKTPFRLSRFGNWELSALRAVSVVEFLTSEVGLPADRLVAAAFAEHQPLVDGDSQEAYALNRRIEFRLVAK